MTNKLLLFCSLVGFTVVLSGCVSKAAQPVLSGGKGGNPELWRHNITAQSVSCAFLPEMKAFDPKGRIEDLGTTRGPWSSIYKSQGPACAMIVHPQGWHGSGVLVSRSGIVLTNSHVVGDRLKYGDDGKPYLEVYLLEFDQSGRAKMPRKPLRGVVVARDSFHDIAALAVPRESVLHIEPVPIGEDSETIPGSEIATIGNAGGLFSFSLRTGTIASYGSLPDDISVTFAQRRYGEAAGTGDLISSEAHRGSGLGVATDGQTGLRSPQRPVMMSNVLSFAGDSGGPTLSERGRLVGLTFGGPSSGLERVMTWHVPLTAIRDFMASIPDPAGPPVIPQIAPEFWFRWGSDNAIGGEARDMIIGRTVDRKVGFFADLDEDSSPDFPQKGDNVALPQVLKRFDAEFACAKDAGIIYADTDNDGTMDLILQFDPKSEEIQDELRLRDGRWVYVTRGLQGQKVLDAQLFHDKGLQQAFKLAFLFPIQRSA